ncbi:MAG: YdgA family protein [Neisseriaceae bacterium]
MLKRIIKIKLAIGIFIVLGLILVQLVSAYIFGFKAEDQLNMQFKKMTNSPYIVVDNYSYKRGFFSSDVSAELSLNSQALTNIIKALPNFSESSILNHKYSIKYTMHITQGIFAGILNGNIAPTIAVAKTKIQYPNSLDKVLSKFFGDKQPLYIKNTIYLNSSGQISVVSPKFDYEEALSGVKIIWNGLILLVSYNKEFDHFNNTLSVPHFSLHAPTKGDILLNDIYHQSNSHYSNNQIKVGDTNIKVKEININLADTSGINFRLGDLLSTFTGITATQFLNELDVINPAHFVLSNVSYVSTSQDSNGYFSAMTNVQFESLVTESSNYGPFNVDVSVDHVLAPEFSKLIDGLTKFSVANTADNVQAKANLIAILKKYFAPILMQNPVLKINNFRLKTPSGLIKLSGNLTTSKFVLDDINNEQDFLNKIQAQIYFSVPKNVLSYLFMVQMQYFLSAGNAEIDQQSSDALKKVVNILLDNQISSWKKKGYIKDNHGILSGNLIYETGKLTMAPK